MFSQFEQASTQYEGVECWSARELQKLFGYTQWHNFENAIEKAKESCQNAGEDTLYHFADVSKTIPMPKWIGRVIYQNPKRIEVFYYLIIPINQMIIYI